MTYASRLPCLACQLYLERFSHLQCECMAVAKRLWRRAIHGGVCAWRLAGLISVARSSVSQASTKAQSGCYCTAVVFIVCLLGNTIRSGATSIQTKLIIFYLTKWHIFLWVVVYLHSSRLFLFYCKAFSCSELINGMYQPVLSIDTAVFSLHFRAKAKYCTSLILRIVLQFLHVFP